MAIWAWAGGLAVSGAAFVLDTMHDPRHTAPVLAWLVGFVLFGAGVVTPIFRGLRMPWRRNQS